MASTGAGKQNVRISVIGAGYWGKNLVRNYHALGTLESVCDIDDETLDRVRKEYRVATTKDYEAILSDPVVEAVVIAVPAALHYELAKSRTTSWQGCVCREATGAKCSRGEGTRGSG